LTKRTRTRPRIVWGGYKTGDFKNERKERKERNERK
jgi:hypothetical protein